MLEKMGEVSTMGLAVIEGGVEERHRAMLGVVGIVEVELRSLNWWEEGQH